MLLPAQELLLTAAVFVIPHRYNVSVMPAQTFLTEKQIPVTTAVISTTQTVAEEQDSLAEEAITIHPQTPTGIPVHHHLPLLQELAHVLTVAARLRAAAAVAAAVLLQEAVHQVALQVAVVIKGV